MARATNDDIMNPGKKPEVIGSEGGCKMLTPIKQEMLEQLDTLPDDMQRRVLDFARALASFAPKGVPGTQLLKFGRSIPSDDLKLISKVIRSDCERVDDDW